MLFFKNMPSLKKLFGFDRVKEITDGQGPQPDNAGGPCVSYQGFTIRLTPYAVNGQYQCCGVITKTIDGKLREHRFIRADTFSSREDANRMIEIKARKLIDEQGRALFDT